MVRIDIDPTGEGVHAYGLLTSLVVPRPIAWVSTVAVDGTGNLAPHSFYSVASANPPIVCFTSVGEKDTLRNVEATREFVVNLASQDLMGQVNATSASFDAGVDEAERVGVEMEPSTHVRPMRVAASPAAIECRLHVTHRIGDSVLVLGQVVGFSVAEEAMVDGRPAMEALRPVSRLGGSEWGLPPEVVDLTRPG